MPAIAISRASPTVSGLMSKASSGNSRALAVSIGGMTFTAPDSSETAIDICSPELRGR